MGMRNPTRMEAVQTPIIPVIGAMIRETPGTISLGQGVVHYGPPPAAIEAARRALGERSTSEYQPVPGLPGEGQCRGAQANCLVGLISP